MSAPRLKFLKMSLLFILVLNCKKINHPPETPYLYGPSFGRVDSTYHFFAVTMDRDGDRIAYQFDWGGGDTSYWSDFFRSGETIRMGKFWYNPGTYSIRVRAKDKNEATSSWSDSHSITIVGVPGTIKWYYRVGVGRVIVSSPAIGFDGTIYIASDAFYAFNPDGTLKWQYQMRSFTDRSPAIGSDGTIYIGDYDGYLYALNPDGTLKWEYKTATKDLVGSPSIGSDGTIYFGSGQYLYAVNPDGTLKWQLETPSGISYLSIDSEGTIYFGWGYDLVAVNPDGTVRWIFPTNGPVYSPVIGSDGTIYFYSSGDGHLYALNPDGTLKWQYFISWWVYSSPVIGSDGTVYQGESGSLYAINPDGTLKWQCRSLVIGGTHSSPALSSDGTIYIGGDGLCAISADGIFKWRKPLYGSAHSSPAIGSDGTIYIGAFENLYAIQGSEPLADTPWPKFKHDLRNTGRAGGPKRLRDLSGSKF